MKKAIAIVLLFILAFSFGGCSDKTLLYSANLGCDFSRVDCQKIVFRIYHSNTENHMWEVLTTFSSSPAQEHFADIRLEGRENAIVMTFEDNYVVNTENTVSYHTDNRDTYELRIDGFSGWIGSFERFEIKDKEGEQLYRLYPISNDSNRGGTFFQELKIDKPYDEEEENLDNILITIQINKE